MNISTLKPKTFCWFNLQKEKGLANVNFCFVFWNSAHALPFALSQKNNKFTYKIEKFSLTDIKTNKRKNYE